MLRQTSIQCWPIVAVFPFQKHLSGQIPTIESAFASSYAPTYPPAENLSEKAMTQTTCGKSSNQSTKKSTSWHDRHQLA
jgi:hypothetical protein